VCNCAVRGLRIAAAVVTALVVATGVAAPASAGVWRSAPPNANRLVTNEYAYWNPSLSDAVRSPVWEMNSGSLFAHRTTAGPAFWTGRVDDRAPNRLSSNGTNAAVFRLTTLRSNFRNVNVRMRLYVNGMSATASTPPTDWDGVHLFLRYQAEDSLYYASVARRDGHIVLKKKCRGGPSNGGTYHTLAEKSGYRIPVRKWRYVSAGATTVVGGKVRLSLAIGDRVVLTALDSGVGCAPIRTMGKLGVRGDNTNFYFQQFQARSA